MGVNKQFQAKMAKYKNHNISETINRIKIVWLLRNMAIRCKMTCRWRYTRQHRN